ncbi:MAG: hypothetical protein Kow0090_04340 [Myxococcota bacterium]
MRNGIVIAFLLAFALISCNLGKGESGDEKSQATKRSDYKVTEDFRAKLKKELETDPDNLETAKLLVEIDTKLLEIYTLWSPYAVELLREILKYDPRNERAISGYSFILMREARNYHEGDERRYEIFDEILKYDPYNKEIIEKYVPYLESRAKQYHPTDERAIEFNRKSAELRKRLGQNR